MIGINSVISLNRISQEYHPWMAFFSPAVHLAKKMVPNYHFVEYTDEDMEEYGDTYMNLPVPLPHPSKMYVDKRVHANRGYKTPGHEDASGPNRGPTETYPSILRWRCS
jgi:hypothetical protein